MEAIDLSTRCPNCGTAHSALVDHAQAIVRLTTENSRVWQQGYAAKEAAITTADYSWKPRVIEAESALAAANEALRQAKAQHIGWVQEHQAEVDEAHRKATRAEAQAERLQRDAQFMLDKVIELDCSTTKALWGNSPPTLARRVQMSIADVKRRFPNAQIDAAWHKDATTTEERAENIYRAGKAVARSESTVELSAEDRADLQRLSGFGSLSPYDEAIAHHFLAVGYRRGVEASSRTPATN